MEIAYNYSSFVRKFRLNIQNRVDPIRSNPDNAKFSNLYVQPIISCYPLFTESSLVEDILCKIYEKLRFDYLLIKYRFFFIVS